MTRGEDLAGLRLPQEPLQRLVAAAPQVRHETHPVEVHVRRERGRGRAVCQAALFLTDLRERQASATELFRDVHREVAGPLQVSEILVEETVLSVVLRGTRSE